MFVAVVFLPTLEYGTSSVGILNHFKLLIDSLAREPSADRLGFEY